MEDYDVNLVWDAPNASMWTPQTKAVLCVESPNGTLFRITVSDDGQLIATPQ